MEWLWFCPQSVEKVRTFSDFKRKNSRGHTPTLNQYALRAHSPLADPTIEDGISMSVPIDDSPEEDDPADFPPRPVVPEPSRSLNADELAKYSLSQR